jgi:hypothetical protein
MGELRREIFFHLQLTFGGKNEKNKQPTYTLIASDEL